MKPILLAAVAALSLSACAGGTFGGLTPEQTTCLVSGAVAAAIDGSIDQAKAEEIAAACGVDLTQVVTNVIMTAVAASNQTEAAIAD